MNFVWDVTNYYYSNHRMLAPTPMVDAKKNVSYFVGLRETLSAPAGLAIFRSKEARGGIQTKLASADFIKVGDNSLVGHGLIPTFSRLESSGLIRLFIARFQKSTKHKHRLLAEEFFFEPDFLQNPLQNPRIKQLDFIDYKSEELHTFAGMSAFGENFAYVKGSGWFLDGEHKTPVTSIFTRIAGTETQLIPERMTHEVIALTRPNFFRIGVSEFLFYSIRAKGGKYFSEVSLLDASKKKVVNQIFFKGNEELDHIRVVYQIPFKVHDETWCAFTDDYRGSNGFYVAKLREMV